MSLFPFPHYVHYQSVHIKNRSNFGTLHIYLLIIVNHHAPMIRFLSRLVLAIQGNGTSRLTFRSSQSAECLTPRPLESISLTESSRSSQMSCGFIIEQDTPLNLPTYSRFWFCNLWQRVRRFVPCLQAKWLRKRITLYIILHSS